MILLLLLAAAPVTSLPPLTPLERSLAAHARDGKLEGTTLLEASLLASGVSEAELPAAARRIRAALALVLAPAKAREQNLAIALHNHASVLLSAGRCGEVRALVPQLDPNDERLLDGVRQVCP